MPFRPGDYVLVNRGTATRPLFYIAKILYSRGYGDDQKVTVEFGSPNLPNTTYPAFTESCLAIVGFAKMSRGKSRTPIVATEEFTEFLYRGGWVAERAIEKWLGGSNFKEARASIRASKKKLPKVDDRYDEELELAFLDEMDRNIAEGKHAEEVDRWVSLLPKDVRSTLKVGLLETGHRICLESLLDMEADILEVLPRPREEMRRSILNNEFMVRIKINRFPEESFVISTQNDNEWYLFKERGAGSDNFLDEGKIDIGVDKGTLEQVLEFVEENTLYDVHNVDDHWSTLSKGTILSMLRSSLSMLDEKDQKIAKLERKLIAKDDLSEEDVPAYLRRFRQDLDETAKNHSVLSAFVEITRRFGEERINAWEKTHPLKLAASCKVIEEFCRDHPEEPQLKMWEVWKPWARKANRFHADDIEDR